jgi:hypothetical protein
VVVCFEDLARRKTITTTNTRSSPGVAATGQEVLIQQAAALMGLSDAGFLNRVSFIPGRIFTF